MESETTETNEQPLRDMTSSFEADIQHTFFYTDNKFFASLDNKEIMSAILQKYPLLCQDQTDAVIKKQIVAFLNDSAFIEQLMEFYNLTVYDIFRVLYTQYGTMFKGPFLKKVKSQLYGKQYATVTRKKHSY